MRFEGVDEWLSIEEFADASGYTVSGVRSLIRRDQVSTSGKWGSPMVSLCSYLRFVERSLESRREKRQRRLEGFKEHRKRQYEVEKENRRRKREERKRLGIKIPRPNRRKKNTSDAKSES